MGSIRYAAKDNTFQIACAPHVAIKLRRLFQGSTREAAGKFAITATAEVAFDLVWFTTRYPLEPDAEAADKLETLRGKHARLIESLADFAGPNYVAPEFALAEPAREYQRAGADIAIRSTRLLIADELGVGKTITALCTLLAPDALPALVVTLTGLQRQWERQVARFTPALRSHRLRSTQPYKFADVRTNVVVDARTGKRRHVPVTDTSTPDVIVTNYQKLDGWVDHLAPVIKTVIFDEVQELRRHDSLKYRAAQALSTAAHRCVGLSATPVYNYGGEIHSVMDAIAPNVLGTREEFTREWCGYASNDDKAKVADPRALGTYLRDSGLMIRRTRKDVGRELPRFTAVRHVVDMDMRRLDTITADIAELARRVLDRIGSPADLMHASGELDWRMRQATGIGKAPAVADFVRLLVESGEPVVLFGWHHEVYKIWIDAFKRDLQIEPAMFTGQQSDAQKDESLRRFTKGETPVMIMSLRAGAGLDGLQYACRTTVIGELDWSPKVIEQCDGRVYRDGQPDAVMSYRIVTEEGSDPVMTDVLGIKEAQAAGIQDPLNDAPELRGADEDHIKRLAEYVLQRARK